jgi:hypothetical protein
VAIVIEHIFDFAILGSTNPKRTVLFDPVPPGPCARIGSPLQPKKIFYSNGRQPKENPGDKCVLSVSSRHDSFRLAQEIPR